MGEPTNEAQLQRRIVKALIGQFPNGWIFHPVGGPYQLPGVPDLLCCLDGLFVGLEVKYPRPGESRNATVLRATMQQRRQIKLINAAGGVAAVVTTVQDALDLVAKAFAQIEVRRIGLPGQAGIAESFEAQWDAGTRDGE